MPDQIVIHCTASIGMCRKEFNLAYTPDDFEGMKRDEIEAMVSTDAFEWATQNYLDIGYELPEGLGMEDKPND